MEGEVALGVGKIGRECDGLGELFGGGVAVALFIEEMPFISEDDLEWIMGRGLAQCLPWPTK